MKCCTAKLFSKACQILMLCCGFCCYFLRLEFSGSVVYLVQMRNIGEGDSWKLFQPQIIVAETDNADKML